MNTTYWKNWPTADNDYVNGASWHLTYPIVLWNLKPAYACSSPISPAASASSC